MKIHKISTNIDLLKAQHIIFIELLSMKCKNYLTFHTLEGEKTEKEGLQSFHTKLPVSGSIPIIFLLQNTTTSNKCEILNNLNLKVGGSSGRVVNGCC